jgi:hypothetical protein
MYRIRILLGTGLLALLFLFGALGYWVVGRVRTDAETFSKLTFERLVAVGEINANQAEGYVRTLLLITAETPEERAGLIAGVDDYLVKNDTALRDYAGRLTSAEARRRLEEFTQSRDRYRDIRQQVILLSEQGNRKEALRLARTALWPAYAGYSTAGDAMLQNDILEATRYANHIQRVCLISQVLTALIAVLSFIGGLSLPILLARLGEEMAREGPPHP